MLLSSDFQKNVAIEYRRNLWPLFHSLAFLEQNLAVVTSTPELADGSLVCLYKPHSQLNAVHRAFVANCINFPRKGLQDEKLGSGQKQMLALVFPEFSMPGKGVEH